MHDMIVKCLSILGRTSFETVGSWLSCSYNSTRTTTAQTMHTLATGQLSRTNCNLERRP